MSVHASSPLSATLIRRQRLFAPPPACAPAPHAVPAPAPDWSGDLRFFVTCYAAGLVFFLVMLS